MIRRSGVALAAAALAGILAGCTSSTYAATSIPTPTTSTAAAGSSSTTAPVQCDNPTQSYDPLPALTGAAADNAVKDIRSRGYLIAGVSADSLLLGSRNPVSGQIEGFDIDVVNAVARAIFGDDLTNRVQLRVIQAGDRIKSLTDGNVDVVVRNMTMNCDRWTQIGFSAEYFESGLKILVDNKSPITSLDGLSGKRVCAPNGSTTMDKVKATSGVIPVGAGTHTGCLVLFQQGQVDAIAGDDTVLAGLVAQDPYAKVPEMKPLTSEPYGVGVKKDRVDLVRYINRVLDTMKADGRWKASYDKWFAPSLGPAPAPPQAAYGRAA